MGVGLTSLALGSISFSFPIIFRQITYGLWVIGLILGGAYVAIGGVIFIVIALVFKVIIDRQKTATNSTASVQQVGEVLDDKK